MRGTELRGTELKEGLIWKGLTYNFTECQYGAGSDPWYGYTYLAVDPGPWPKDTDASQRWPLLIGTFHKANSHSRRSVAMAIYMYAQWLDKLELGRFDNHKYMNGGTYF